MCSCRHGTILTAANMFMGETYRHTHFIHTYLKQKKYKFLCSDVACKYWPFAEKVDENAKDPNYINVTQNMSPFLGRMHGRTHTWSCQVW